MEKLTLVLQLITLGSLLMLQGQAEANKVTRLRFYIQDVIGGDHPTVWSVAQSNLTDVLPSAFGQVLVLDNFVTSEADVNSAAVGRVQGTVVFSDLRDPALVMLINIVFTGGEYEGSTLSILGRNPIGAEVREISIVAGTGKFRLATGYIITSTSFSDPANVRNVYEYNAVVVQPDHALFLPTDQCSMII